MTDLQLMRLRLVTLLRILAFRKSCIELGAEIGIKQVFNGITGRPIDWSELALAAMITLAGVEGSKMSASIGKERKHG